MAFQSGITIAKDPYQTNKLNPYQTNLPTNFDNFTGEGSLDRYNDVNKQYGSDSDVSGALRAGWELQNKNAGTSGAEQQALLNMYRTRIGIKNELGSQIASNPEQLQMAKDNLNQSAGAALEQGTRNTRQNFNSRGLLYSGMRQGGEQSVRGAVAGQLASGTAAAERGAKTSLEAAKSAYASVDLANQQEALKMAHDAFDTANANNIARLQAMQTLGEGVGRSTGLLAGNYYGPQQRPPNTSSPY